LLVVPGLALSIVGIGWVVGGDQGLDLFGMLANIKSNPLSYGLAFAGALVWAAYCTVTTNVAKGKNGVTLFFIFVSLALWAKFFLEDHGPVSFSKPAVVYLLLAAAAMGFGYAAWNVGILHGNVTVLAGSSYFIPVFSSALSAVLLHAPLPKSFWIGASLVCAGSILCWRANATEKSAAAQGKVSADLT
jgi:drug/metabolite transporter (DMT)-like permease